MKTQVRAGKATLRLATALLLLLAGCSRAPDTPLVEVQEFGSNPGALRMFKYVPDSLRTGPATASIGSSEEGFAERENATSPETGSPLVVALHGCTQDAAELGEHSGWIQLADRWGLLLLLPQQQRRNNLTRCFNWYSSADTRRDGGEAVSIRQMIARMSRDHAVDPKRIYVTGISAGAAMSLAMAAAYPEVFAGAAPIAGVAVGCADGLFSGIQCMLGPPDRTAKQWGEAVRAATAHEGPWPRLSVWQGGADSAVDPANATTILHQWTHVHGIESAPELADGPQDSVHSLYRDPSGAILIESYRIPDMAHGMPVDPGPGSGQCGKAGSFFPDVGICSSLYIASFWGIGH